LFEPILFNAKVRCVHVIPSGDVAAIIVPLATAQKRLPFQAIDDHVALAGSTRCVHVIPSGDVAAIALL
jgi:hypothetical protein